MLQINLTGKTAIITGATGELGRVMSRTLAECGANIIIHYNSNKSKALELSEELVSKYNVKTYIVCANVGDINSVMAMRDDIKENFVMPEIVITAAVAQYKWTTILEQNVEDYESQFQTCVLHNVNMAKAFVPTMIENNYGKYVGINTECAYQCVKNQSAYISGKRGMDGIIRVLAREVGEHNINVNEVAPGWTISEAERTSGIRESESYNKACPLRRRGTDQEIANAVAFLASDLASFITGVYLPVTGGNVMPGI